MSTILMFLSEFRYFVAGGVIDLVLTWLALRRAKGRPLPLVTIWLAIPAVTVFLCASLAELANWRQLSGIGVSDYLCALVGGLVVRSVFFAGSLPFQRERDGSRAAALLLLTVGCLASPVGAFWGFFWSLASHLGSV